MKTIMLTAVSLLLVLAACGTSPDEVTVDPDATQPDSAPQESTTTQPPSPDPEEPPADEATPDTAGDDVTNADLSDAIEVATADLAGRLGMGEADIQVFSAVRVTWRDGSLGCPQEGMAYTQALVTDGYRIILTANGELHHYHGRGSSAPFYCATPQEPYAEGAGPDA